MGAHVQSPAHRGRLPGRRTDPADRPLSPSILDRPGVGKPASPRPRLFPRRLCRLLALRPGNPHPHPAPTWRDREDADPLPSIALTAVNDLMRRATLQATAAMGLLVGLCTFPCSAVCTSYIHYPAECPHYPRLGDRLPGPCTTCCTRCPCSSRGLGYRFVRPLDRTLTEDDRRQELTVPVRMGGKAQTQMLRRRRAQGSIRPLRGLSRPGHGAFARTPPG